MWVSLQMIDFTLTLLFAAGFNMLKKFPSMIYYFSFRKLLYDQLDHCLYYKCIKPGVGGGLVVSGVG